jgi:hypothetical protein
MELSSPEAFEREEKEKVKLLIAKRKPWDNYTELVQKGNISFKEVQDRILEAAKLDFKLAAATAILYLSASRIKEIIDYTYLGTYADKLPPIHKPGIRICDIDEKEDDEGVWIYCTTRNEKQNSKRGDILEFPKGITLEERYKKLVATNTKTVKLLLEESCPDYKLLLLIKHYVTGLSEVRDIDEGDEIFAQVTRAHLSRFINKFVKVSPHVLRHLRMVHLRKIYGLDVAELKEYGGWSSAEMPLRYSKANAQQIGERFLTTINENRKKWEPFQNIR